MKGIKGSTQDYGMRMYDPRVGRFFSADPLKFKYPFYTPYQFAGNMPIRAIDLDGAEPYYNTNTSNTVTITNPQGNDVSVPSGGTVTQKDENGNALSYSWDSPDGGKNTITWVPGSSTENYGGYEYSYESAEAVAIEQEMENGQSQLHLPTDDQWQEMGFDGDDPTGFYQQLELDEQRYQQQQAAEQARIRENLYRKIGMQKEYGNLLGAMRYYADNSDTWCE